MNFWIVAIALFAVCATLTAGAVAALLPRLRAWQIIDRPNDRSSHRTPTPRGGGLAVVAVLTPPLAAAIWLLSTAPAALIVTVAFVGLAALSWQDDRRGLSPAIRLAAQVVAVAASLAVFPSDQPVFQGLLPLWIDRVVAGLFWVWMINLYNFMDGIDGITGAETTVIGAGVVLLGAVSGLPAPAAWLGAAVTGASVGFLLWNWSPAKLFLGDVGSVPLGYVAGLLMLYVAALGHPAAALILPLYYLTDATLTLLLRLLRGESVWHAHREHAYQVAAAVRSHAFVVRRIALLGILLIVMAATAASFSSAAIQFAGFMLAAAATGLLVWYFERVVAKRRT
jgi:UDP-N-acetylmuramyl pentapeptide phosphotransferase/UDP-N-acetylglucosamine-1-phosphate transferase